MPEATIALIGWERALMAAEMVKERMRRATRALDAAGVRYAVVGGNAVAEWVARVDEGAVRNTRDVDILIRREDFDALRETLEIVGFYHYFGSGIDIFIDGPDAMPRKYSGLKNSLACKLSAFWVFLFKLLQRI